jgi:tetratricopeptide (TPR) repeat protein
MSGRICGFWSAVILWGLCLPLVRAADEPTNKGQADLDKAIEVKLSAQSPRELGDVIDLCDLALQKGLDKDNTTFAEQLLASTLVQRGEIFAGAILGNGQPDPRWRQLRQLALTDLERSLKFDKKQPQTHMLIGRLHLYPDGDRKRAMSALNEAVENGGEDDDLKAEALTMRGGLQDNDDDRLADFSAAIKLTPLDPKPLRARGALMLSQEKPEKALEDLDAALKLDSKDAATYEIRGIALTLLKRLKEARESFTQAAELAPNTPDPYIQRARVNLFDGNAEAALEDANAALKIDPESPAALLLRSHLYESMNKTDEALVDVNHVLRNQPGLPQALRTRAAILATSGKYDAAAADLLSVSRLDPKDTTALLQLAMVYSAQRQLSKALQAYDSVIKLDSDNWIAYRGRADANLSVGKQKEAIADYETALKLQPKNGGILNNLAWVLATSPVDELRDGKRAVELATRACEETEYKQAHILSTLAASYAETGDFKTAMEWSTKAVEAADEKMKENLTKELKSYEAKKPWRESQNEPVDPTAAQPEKTDSSTRPNTASRTRR